MELTEFRSRNEAAAADGIGIYGISVDSVFSHQAFTKELGGLPYELIADFERKMVTDYGVRRDDREGYSGIPPCTVFVNGGSRTTTWPWTPSRETPRPHHSSVVD